MRMENMVRCYKDYSSGMPLGPERKGDCPLSPADRREMFQLIREELDRLRAGGGYCSHSWEKKVQAEMAWL